MLIIASDIHLGDGTCARSIAPNAFFLLSQRLRELAFNASFQEDGGYHPVEEINLVLMGDILDPLHSTRWFSDPGIRPWSDPSTKGYVDKLREVTRAIFDENQAACAVLKSLASGEVIRLPSAVNDKPDFSAQEQIYPQVYIHYMAGNHDWYYHLPGKEFDQIRLEIIDRLGLCNPESNFPWEASEHPALEDIFKKHKVYGQHGDKYDRFNFDVDKGRNAGSLGDFFTMEVINRFPAAVMEELGEEIPGSMLELLRQLTNVRPILAAPLWISSCIEQYSESKALMGKLKSIWDRITDEFLDSEFIRKQNKPFKFDTVDAMKLIIKFTNKASFQTIDDVIIWMRAQFWEDGLSYSAHALKEAAFLDQSAKYIVYGHTHKNEIIPLDVNIRNPEVDRQIYFNSGTWHSFHDLAIRTPEAHKFIHYQAMTYLTFYTEKEAGSRSFESWSGVIG